MRHHALGEQAGEGFGYLDLADAGQRAGPEAGIEQVQDRVLDPADVLFHRQPLRDLRRIERLVRRLAGEAQEIPRTVDKSVERIGFALGRLAALRAIDVLPGRMAQERVAGRLEIDVLGQDDRQLLLGHRHHAAAAAVDEGDRRAPVTLARNAPVAQAVLGFALAPAVMLGPCDDCCLGLGHRHAVHPFRIHDAARPGIGFVAVEGGRRLVAFGHHAGDG